MPLWWSWPLLLKWEEGDAWPLGPEVCFEPGPLLLNSEEEDEEHQLPAVEYISTTLVSTLQGCNNPIFLGTRARLRQQLCFWPCKFELGTSSNKNKYHAALVALASLFSLNLFLLKSAPVEKLQINLTFYLVPEVSLQTASAFTPLNYQPMLPDQHWLCFEVFPLKRFSTSVCIAPGCPGTHH